MKTQKNDSGKAKNDALDSGLRRCCTCHALDESRGTVLYSGTMSTCERENRVSVFTRVEDLPATPRSHTFCIILLSPPMYLRLPELPRNPSHLPKPRLFVRPAPLVLSAHLVHYRFHVIDMQSITLAFVLPASLSTTTRYRHRSQCARTPPFAKKGPSGKKRSKSGRTKRAQSNSPSKPASPSSSIPRQQASSAPLDASSTQFPGPLSPDMPGETDMQADNLPDDDEKTAMDAEIAGASDIPVSSDGALPLPDEGKLRLPDIGSAGAGKSVRRKRKPRALEDVKEERSLEVEKTSKEPLPTDMIRRLTQAYRTDGKEAELLINELEKDPDFMFQTGNPEGEYDLTSAIIGTGRPNKQGVYVLPYLQSGHLLLLLVVLLCTFVYYPGFPLTELDDSVRDLLKGGLALTYTINVGLAVLAFKDAKKRGQPAAFWALKTAFLGNIAFNELRRNAPASRSEKK